MELTIIDLITYTVLFYFIDRLFTWEEKKPRDSKNYKLRIAVIIFLIILLPILFLSIRKRSKNEANKEEKKPSKLIRLTKRFSLLIYFKK